MIRDSKGQVIAAAIKSARFQENLSIAEVEAVKQGMEMAIDARLTRRSLKLIALKWLMWPMTELTKEKILL